MSLRLQIFRGICVGRASRLTQSDIRPQARRQRYISEVTKQTAVGLMHYIKSTGAFVQSEKLRGICSCPSH